MFLPLGHKYVFDPSQTHLEQFRAHFPNSHREFKLDFQYQYQQQVMRMRCARKKPEKKCSPHY